MRVVTAAALRVVNSELVPRPVRAAVARRAGRLGICFNAEWSFWWTTGDQQRRDEASARWQESMEALWKGGPRWPGG